MTVIMWILVFVFFLWLIGLTYFLWKLQSHYNMLIEGTDSRTLQVILSEVMHDIKDAKKHIVALQTSSQILHEDGKLHIQKIGLLRFNPFNDTGGDQSFVLALLSAHNTGIVISGLYARSGMRWYAKRVTEGKGIEHELSTEEKKVIEIAQAN